MSGKYIISLDEGTTSCRAVLFDVDTFKTIDFEQEQLTMYYPNPGWVEQDGEEIFAKQYKCLEKLIKKLDSSDNVLAIGITNQRESVLLWEKESGKPIGPCVNWQCKRTAAYCNELIAKSYTDNVKEKTGLVIDAYFSGSKIKWLLDNIPNARELAQNGKICVGTIDSYLIYRLTNGKKHLTDATNASRTMLYNINKKEWDEDLLNLLDIPKNILPEVVDCTGNFGTVNIGGRIIPISGIAGDQQASLFGQACLKKGDSKCTYGTGAFILTNIGDKPIISDTPLITTIAYSIGGKTKYAFEGSVFNAGAVISWLKDIGIINKASECEHIALSAKPQSGVFFVPAFSGLGAPYWDMDCRAAMLGITRGTGIAELVRAALESIAFRVSDICDLVEKTLGSKLPSLNVDGGAAQNSFLLQFQSDLIGAPIYKAKEKESTALGAAYLAAMGIGIIANEEELVSKHKYAAVFIPKETKEEIDSYKEKWKIAVNAARQGNFN